MGVHPTVPKLDWAIPRPRLLERLRKGTRGPLTVVTGPPGSGKTFTVALWAATEPHPPGPIAWISCDQMPEPGPGLCAAVCDVLGAAGIEVPPAIRADVDGIAVFLAGLDEPVVLVMDDFRLSRDALVAESLGRLLRGAGPGLRVVLTSRTDPPLPLNRYRLAGELTEIRSVDLAFHEREIAAVLAQHGVRLGGAALRALRERTEGWAAGVRLAAMSMQTHPAPAAFVEHFAGDDHAVVEYLMDEVLDAQPVDVGWLLLATSVVDRVNAELAAALAGQEAAMAFPEMVRQNSFVVPLEHGWYRYHSMFGQALRLVLRHESPAKVPELHRRACAWFDRADLVTEAVQQAALAKDWRHASWLAVNRLAIGHVLGLRPRADLAETFGGIPAEVIDSATEPEPAIVAAAASLSRGDERHCAALLDQAEALMGELPADNVTAARLGIGVVRLALPGGAAENTATAVAEVLGRFPDRLRADRPELTALVLTSLGVARLRSGDLPAAAQLLGEAIEPSMRAGGDFQRRRCLGELALTEALRGRLARAAELAARAAQLPEVSATPAGRRVAAAHLATAWVDLEQCRLVAVRIELERAVLALREQPDTVLSSVLLKIAARLELAQGRPERALEALSRLAEQSSLPSWLQRRLMILAADAHSARGAAGEARTAAERAGGARALESAVALSRANICGGDAGAAARSLRPTLGTSAGAAPDVRVDAWLLDSFLSYRAGDGSRGRRSLDQALRLADREQISLPFMLAKAWLRPVLWRDPELCRPYRRLLEPVQPVLCPQGPTGLEGDLAATVEPLSSRELDVLRDLAEMMTTEEIAVSLSLSINTIKTHLKSIYRKLGVTRRGEAVRRARRLALLEDAEVTGPAHRLMT